MKTIIWAKYRPPVVLQIMEVEKPILNDTEVLVKIYAANQ